MTFKAPISSFHLPPPPSIGVSNRLLIPMLNIVPANSDTSIYSSTLDYFSSIPWCHALLQHCPSDSTTSGRTVQRAIPFIPGSRNLPAPDCEQLFSSTLATPEAIPHVLCFFRPDDATHARDAQRPITQVYVLFSLGTGLSRYTGLVNGGLTAALMDEAAGILSDLNINLGKKNHVLVNGVCITKSLKINFLRPVRATGVIVLARMWIESAQKHKVLIRGELTGSHGERLAEAELDGVQFRPKL
ncbi:hypothetical protein CDD82_3543 [Ophiocordyceps australis]|uniref:Thioesterase domain-containing protein n=1 Tax=Ophiocordyceps australis TaxID=1399860 RepID=A0A2C5Z6B5_9HYPO|nr:hypothetical protein CDD82_3543 [Ophiocordyceps australis]